MNPLVDAAYARHPVLDTQTGRDSILRAEANDIEAYGQRVVEDYDRLKTQLRLCEEHASTMAHDFDLSLEIVRAERDKLRAELIAKL